MARKRKKVLRHKRISEKSNLFEVEIDGVFVGVMPWSALDGLIKHNKDLLVIDETDSVHNKNSEQ